MFNINRHTKLSKLLLVWSLILTLIVCHSYFQVGLPQTHDGSNHLARFANYKIAVKEGQFPPRLAPNLMNHYTYPVFNYNYPLANLLSLPFSALKISYETIFKLLSLLFLFFGGWGTAVMVESFFYAQDEKKQHKSSISSWSIGLALVVYYSSVYLINLIFFRGSIGEIMAYGLWPWMINSVITKPKINVFNILLWTGWWLVHNVMAVFGWPILFLAALMNQNFKFNNLKKYLLLGLISLFASLWFWLPALAELNLISAGHSQIVSNSSSHLLRLGQLFFGQTQFGFSRTGSIDDISFALGILQTCILVLGLSLLIFKIIFRQKKKKGRDILLPLLAVAVVLLIFQLTVTKDIWIYFKPLQIIQFPWRLGFFIPVFLSVLAVYIWQNLNSKLLKLLFILLSFGQIFQLIHIKPEALVHQSNADWDAFPESTTTNNEDKPETFKYLLIGDWQPAPFITNGDGISTVGFWSGSRHTYNLQLATEAVIIEPVMMFAGWQTTVNNKLVEYYDNDNIQGRLAYRLPAGEYKIESKFTQHTWSRMLGNMISLTTGICITIFFFLKKWRYDK